MRELECLIGDYVKTLGAIGRLGIFLIRILLIVVRNTANSIADKDIRES